jgi:hypothetical protein
MQLLVLTTWPVLETRLALPASQALLCVILRALKLRDYPLGGQLLLHPHG